MFLVGLPPYHPSLDVAKNNRGQKLSDVWGGLIDGLAVLNVAGAALFWFWTEAEENIILNLVSNFQDAN